MKKKTKKKIKKSAACIFDNHLVCKDKDCRCECHIGEKYCLKV